MYRFVPVDSDFSANFFLFQKWVFMLYKACAVDRCSLQFSNMFIENVRLALIFQNNIIRSSNIIACFIRLFS